MRSRIPYALVSVSVLLCGALLTGCSKTITVPASDSTPPEITLHVFGVGEPLDLKPGDADVSRPAGSDAEIVLIATARDQDGGVKNVRIDGSATVVCTPSGISVHFVNQNPEASDVGPGDEAQDSRATNLHIKIAELKEFCPADSAFQSLSAGYRAAAQNFHGGTTLSPAFAISHP
jgi:hypothetical protein